MALAELIGTPMTEIERIEGIGPEQIPEWAWEVLASPGGGPLHCEHGILRTDDQPIGRITKGILHFDMVREDPSTEYYRTIGGAHFHERASVHAVRRRRLQCSGPTPALHGRRSFIQLD